MKKRLAWRWKLKSYRPNWFLVGAGMLFLLCLTLFSCDVLNVLGYAEKAAFVDNGVCNAIGELRVTYAQESMARQNLIELAADGKQELSPAWRSSVINYGRACQRFRSTLQEAVERVRLSEKFGLQSSTLVAQLFELEQIHERLQNDVLTIARLTDERRSDEIAAMHETVNTSAASMEEQLLSLHQFAQISVLSTSKKIQSSGRFAFWTGMGTILLCGIISGYVCYRNRKIYQRPIASDGTASAANEEDYLEIATEQALTERFLLRGVHVLVAEDDPATRRLLARVFEHAGAVVTVACDGGQAMNQFRKSTKSGHPVQLVILDLIMPSCDGFQVAAQLRELEGFSGPILALTAVPDKDIRLKCLESGFDDYLCKPIERKRLLKLATDYLGKATPV